MNGTPLYISLFFFALYSCGLMGFAFAKLELPITIALWLAGLFAFTLVEYLLHRYFFHMDPDTVKKTKVQYSIHGNHHAQPHETTGMMMRPMLAVAVLFVLTALFYFIFGWNALALLPGFLFGYSCYLFIHFAIHAFKPPRHFLRYLWKLHNLHHFHDDTANYGVSSPLWDIVFGTYLPKKKLTKRKQHEDA